MYDCVYFFVNMHMELISVIVLFLAVLPLYYAPTLLRSYALTDLGSRGGWTASTRICS